MLRIIRSAPETAMPSAYLNATVQLIDDETGDILSPDVTFSMRTYEKIAKEGQAGDTILLPINLFMRSLTLAEQTEIHKMYEFCLDVIGQMTMDNMRTIQDRIRNKVFEIVRKFKLAEKLIAFCNSSLFRYPNLDDVGKEPHHTAEKTFLPHHYAELTAIAILSKMMIPIWGEFIKQLGEIEIGNLQREKIAFDLIDPVLVDTGFKKIYHKLSRFLASNVSDICKSIDKRSMGNTTTSFILTNNYLDKDAFNSVVMATIVVKRMATYECFDRLKDGNIPNAMVYIHDGIRRTAESRIKAMRNQLDTMPRKELAGHESEDNNSIIDHVSRTSKKPIDVPITVTYAVDRYEIPQLLEESNTPIDLYKQVVEYYKVNPFVINPVAQAMLASFVGIRFGGTRCLNYLPITTTFRLITILQIFLIRNDMVDLASVISAKVSQTPLEGVLPMSHARIIANAKASQEYNLCVNLFRGYMDKPLQPYGRKRKDRRDVEVERIEFSSTIEFLTERLTQYQHIENMAPALWDFANIADRPLPGHDCRFSEDIISRLCKFYLMFHSESRPF